MTSTNLDIERFENSIFDPRLRPLIVEYALLDGSHYVQDYIDGKIGELQDYHPELCIASFWVFAGELSELLKVFNYSIECGYEQREDRYWLRIKASPSEDSIRNVKMKHFFKLSA